jgi:RimJ/RimL family protein N-acetyltransferase
MPTPDLQPTLIGPRIIVRPIAPTDWDEMFAAAADPEVWALHPVRERYQAEVFREFFDGALKSGAAFSFVDRRSQKVIGSSRYYGHDPERREIEIGWTFIARAHWGGSINAEVKRLMLDHAFTFCDTVVFWVGETIGARSAPWENRRRAPPRPPPRELAGTTYQHVVFEIRTGGFKG